MTKKPPKQRSRPLSRSLAIKMLETLCETLSELKGGAEAIMDASFDAEQLRNPSATMEIIHMASKSHTGLAFRAHDMAQHLIDRMRGR